MHLNYSKDYYKKNPTYHVEDAKFKWSNFKKIIVKSDIDLSNIKLVGEVGCGSGQILSAAKNSGLFRNCEFHGYDTNPDAINLAKRLDGSIEFYKEDLINKDLKKKFQLLIVSDVFEHVTDYYNFLKKLRDKAEYLIFNIPLQISLINLLRKKNIFEISYNQVGHLHFFANKTAILALEKNGYKIIDYTYAQNRLFSLKKNFSIKKFLIFIPEYLLSLISNDISTIIFGGRSLAVIVKSN